MKLELCKHKNDSNISNACVTSTPISEIQTGSSLVCVETSKLNN